MTTKQQFTLAFVFFQVACIGVALGAARALMLVVFRTTYGPPIGPECLLYFSILSIALGVFAGKFFERPVLGGMLGLVSVPIVILVLVLAIFALAAAGVQGPWSV